MMKLKLKLCVGVMLLLAVGGCKTSDWTGSSSSAARYDGPASTSAPSDSAKPGTLSPLEAHLRARRMVDPSDTRPLHEYGKLAIPPGEEPPLPAHKPAPQNKFMNAMTGLIGDDDVSPQPLETAQKAPYHLPLAKITTAPRPGGVGVNDLRMGEHPDKTRFVFDLTGKTSFVHEMSADNRLLTIRLPGVGWNTTLKRDYFSHPYVSGYTARNDGRDTVIRLTMKRPVRFLTWAYLPPDQGRPHRVYFDVAP